MDVRLYDACRHSFASVAVSQHGLSLAQIGEQLGHIAAGDHAAVRALARRRREAERHGDRWHDCGVAEAAGAMMPRREAGRFDSVPPRAGRSMKRWTRRTLTGHSRIEIERHLTDYRAAPRADAAVRPADGSRSREMILLRASLDWLDVSVEDLVERQVRRDGGHSVSREAAAVRIRQWDRPYIWKNGRAARPLDWRRRIVLFRVMMALDTADVPPSCHGDGASVCCAKRSAVRMRWTVDGSREGACA